MGNIECYNHLGKKVILPEERFYKRPSVYGVIRNGQKILVTHNRSNSDLSLPGGGIESGESPEEALRREVLEEAGITNFTIGRLLAQFHNYFYYGPEDLAMDADIFIYECTTNESELLRDEDIDDCQAYKLEWISPEEAVSRGFMISVHDKISDCLKMLK